MTWHKYSSVEQESFSSQGAGSGWELDFSFNLRAAVFHIALLSQTRITYEMIHITIEITRVQELMVLIYLQNWNALCIDSKSPVES